jgi:DNA-binding CsgD family transcriptional regulator
MPRTENPSAEPERILAWYELVQDVYETGEALATPQAAPTALAALLHRAAVYFGLEELEHCQGPSPMVPVPGQLVLRLPPVHATANGVTGCSAPGAAAGRHEHYLRARSGPLAAREPALRSQLERFGQHLTRCLQINAGLTRERQLLHAMYETLDRQPLALVLYDFQGRVRFKNRAAIRAQTRHPELQLDLHAQDPARCKDQPLVLLFQRFRQNLQRGECGVIQHGSKTRLLTLVPMLSSTASVVFAPQGPSLALLIQERAWSRELPAKHGAHSLRVPAGLSRRLQERFTLTPSEVRLCYGLYAGLSVASYASVVGRSPLTIRKQLKSSYLKLDVHDQKSLILRTWQEQQAEWLQSVTLFVSNESGAEAATLLYPPARAEAGCPGNSDLARARLSLSENSHVHA